MPSWPIRRHAEGLLEHMWRAMATDCKILSPLSPNCGVPLELPVAVRSKPIAQLARYIARVSPARGRGLAHEIKYDGFRYGDEQTKVHHVSQATSARERISGQVSYQSC